MIDTMHIFWRFHSKTEFLCAQRIVDSVTKDIPRGNLHKDKKDKNAQVTYGLAKIGFRDIKFRYVKEKKYCYYAIEIILRPKLLVEEDNYIDVLHAYEIPKVRERFNSIINGVLGLDLPDFIYWKVKRIDYAIDLYIQEYFILKYLFYFKKGNIPMRMLEHHNTIKYFDEENNLYLCSDSYTVNIYARSITLIERQEKLKKEFINIGAAKNIMRFEAQYMVDTFRLKQQGKISENELRYFLNVNLCQSIIEYHFNAIIGIGNYYILEKAIQIINDKIQSFKERLLMERMLKLISSKGSIWAAKLSYVDNSGDKEKALKEFSRIINRIRDCNINPVTLSDELEISELDGLSDKIHAYFENARSTEQGYLKKHNLT